jgi:hypothetical protein
MQIVRPSEAITSEAVRERLSKPLKEPTIRVVLERLEDNEFFTHSDAGVAIGDRVPPGTTRGSLGPRGASRKRTTASTRSSKRKPASVATTPRPRRTSNLVPRTLSSLRSCWLTADAVGAANMDALFRRCDAAAQCYSPWPHDRLWTCGLNATMRSITEG